MSTVVPFLEAKDESWRFYLETLDNYIYLKVSTPLVEIEIKLMPLAEWAEMGLPTGDWPVKK